MLGIGISATRSWAAALLFSALVAAFMILPAPAAEAHRDGCHRWHSCPSDTGSYVCGDLGYYSECPGGKPSKDDSTSATPETDYEPPDYEAPNTPHLARSLTGAGGRVTVKVRAEKRSTIRVRTETGKQVAKITASGKQQKIRFKAKTGHRTYTVTATDKAGNESLEATTTVNVDATAPRLSRVIATAGTDVTGASSLSFTSDPGATWTLTGAGRKSVRGTVTEPTTTLALWLPNGTYKPSLTVRDKIGNTRGTTMTMRVRVPRPLLRATRTSASTERRLAYALTGTPRSTGKLILKHLDAVPFSIDDHGSASIALDAVDGTYGPGRAVLTDFAGRTTTAALPEVVVDTTAPTLDLTVDPAQAKTGTLSLQVAAELGSTVRLTAPLKDIGGDDERLAEMFTATAVPTRLIRRPAAGSYTVVATAADAVGNTTTRQVDVDIVIPATPTETALGIAILLWFAAIPVAAAILIWHFRGRIGAWRARQAEAARRRKAQRAARAAEAAYRRQLAAHTHALGIHRAALADWERHRRRLNDLISKASTFQPTNDTEGLLQLKRSETCYGTFSAVMVEQRTRQGGTTLEDAAAGQAVITSHRVVFVADKKREWTFTKLDRVVQDGPLTLLSVSNRKQPSGLRPTPGSLDDFRLRLDLALADRLGDRQDIISRRLRALHLHDQQKPVAPTPPIPPTAPPATTGTPTTTLR
ncbi:hypothetical protein [Microlunatus flavus]|uniref:Ig-like domain (Group 3) n=1 Tax=Microlunatus flavus TaxID=1036181 RepID=A0A1H9MWP2_9ACTN|nr:hypothetical protein [Microlunatus flavus]SER27825.1 hypothetical protein SAMN05421756_111103 [Microlunatus flavus]